MDPEIQREYEEHMRTMVDLLSQQAAATSKLLNSLQSGSNTTTSSVKNNTDATKKQTEAISGATKAQEAATIAQQKYAEAMNNFANAVGNSKIALKDFARAVIDSEKGLGKYGSSIGAAGEAVGDLGKNFGIFGTVLGGIVSILGAFAGQGLQAVDSVIQFRDETSKFTGILPTTVEGLQELGSNARFSGDQIMKLSQVMSGFGTNILSLGGSAGESAVKFMKVAAVSDDVRRQFGRLGVDQERLLEMQGMYIQMQGVSGKAMENRAKSEAQIQKESLAYARNLIVMSDLTGKTAEQMQKEQEIAKSEFEEQVKIRQENIQIRKLEQAGDRESLAAAAAIRKEQDNRTALINAAAKTYDAEMAAQIGRMARTGAYDTFTGSMATLGMSAAELKDTVKNSNNIQGDSMALMQKFTTLQSNMVEATGESLQYSGEELAKSLGITNKTITKGNDYIGKNLEDEYERLKAAATAKEQEGDKVADDVEEVRSAERELRKVYYDAMMNLGTKVLPGLAAALTAAADTIKWLETTIRENIDTMISFAKGVGIALAALLGLTVIGKVVSLFGGLATATKGITSGFSGLKNAFSGMINWVKGLVGLGTAGATLGPDGRYRDAQGRFAKAPTGGMSGLVRGAGGILGKLALPFAAGMAAYDAYQGFNADPNASFGGKLANAGKGALSGMTFGLSDYITGGVTTGTEAEKKVKEVQDAEQKKVDDFSKSVETTEKNTEQSTKDTEKFRLSTIDMHNQIGTFARIIEAYAKSVWAFAISVGSFSKTIKDYKEFMEKQQLGTTGGGGGFGTQFGGNIDQILATIRKRESGGDYQAQAKGSSASGAYQFMDSTWQAKAKQFGIGTEFKSAKDAPKEIQDKLAAAYVSDILKRAGGDVSKVPIEWYTGNLQGKMSDAAIRLNNGLTPEVYQKKWMEDFQQAGMSAQVGMAGAGSEAIVNLGRQLQSQGLRVTGHSMFGGREEGRHSKNSRHYKDLAIDINVGTGVVEADDPEHGARFDMLAENLRRAGFSVLWRSKGHDDHMHVSVGSPEGVKAARGGVFTGSSGGYPATLHGTEVVAPLTMDSILMKLAKTPAANMEDISNTNSMVDDQLEKMTNMHTELMDVISRKLDNMIDALDDGNTTRTKILKNNMV